MTKPETFSEEFRPPWAVTAWVDEVSVYIEVPSKAGPPTIISFPLSGGGLGKALEFMRGVHQRAGRPASPTRFQRRPEYASATMERAQAILKKNGMGR